MDDNDIKDTNDLISKIQQAEPSFWGCESTADQFLKNIILF